MIDLMPNSSIDASLSRCTWCSNDPDYMAYHDKEWGVLVTEDRLLFEFLTLEGAQAGLSWITILKRRENYRKAFDGFDFVKISQYSALKMEELMNNPGIIRNKAKIRSAVNNAQCFIKVLEEFGGFFPYTMHFFSDNKPIINHPEYHTSIPVKSAISMAMSRDMKKRGFTFFGPVICYAHLQATGAINDHIKTCFLASPL